MKKLACATGIVLAVAFAMVGGGLAHAADSWTGEIVGRTCFVERDQHGPDHADCAKRCISRGGDMGLVTDDGTLLVLRPSPDNDAPYEALKELAGANAKVMGQLGEEDGHQVLVVTAAEAVD